MPDVLDQNEVDALLAAVATGEVSTEADQSQTRRAVGQKDVEVRLYDFKRPERVSKDQMRSLEALHEGFARNFGASLSGFLRTIIECRVASVEQLTYSEFIHALPNPTCFHILKCKALDGSTCLELNPSIVFPIVDRLLGGGSDESYIPDRPLTSIEARLVNHITSRCLESLNEVWANVYDMQFELTETESNPQLAQIVPPNEVVVVIGFELKLGVRAGLMNLCIPFNVIEPIMHKFTAEHWFSYQRKAQSDKSAGQLLDSVSSAQVQIRCILAETQITLRDLLELRVGDIIRTDKLADSELAITIGGAPKFACRPGKLRGQKAIRITRSCSPKERL